MNPKLLRVTNSWIAACLFTTALADLFHACAFDELFYGAERPPFGTHLPALVLIQTASAIGIAIVVRRLRADLSAPASRFAGA